MLHLSSALRNFKFAMSHQSIGSALAVRRRLGVHRRFIRRWAIEPLEGRVVPSTITVKNTHNAGPGSLRAAIEHANVDATQDTITFARSVKGTIILLSALPDLSAGMNIVGPGPSTLTVARSLGVRTDFFTIFTLSSGAQVAISGLKITGGSSIGFGGGIENSGTLSIANDIISGNFSDEVYNIAGCGGGIDNSGTLSITDSTISGNTALAAPGLFDNGSPGTGGGINNTGTLSVIDSTFSGNSASGGGAIYNSGTATITCSTFSGNTAPVYGTSFQAPGQGGGIDNSGNLSITYSTFSGNSASIGGGIDNSSQASVIDTIVASNTQVGNGAASDIGGDVTGSYNLIGTGGSGGLMNGQDGNIVLSNLTGLRLSRLGHNGGRTQTIALLKGSRAIDAGIAVSGVTTDQRGIIRPPSHPDIGAFEVASSMNKRIPRL